jgi:hypothetical protein
MAKTGDAYRWTIQLISVAHAAIELPSGQKNVRMYLVQSNAAGSARQSRDQ